MSGKYRKEHNCLNCGQHVEKHYCSNCGQANLEIKENFWQFISHSIAHYFHFDNKFFQTLKPLLIEPGQVTLDYLAGKRARYINPVSMYIFVSIVYFLVVPKKLEHEQEKQQQHETVKNVKAATSDVRKDLKEEGFDENSFVGKTANFFQKKVNAQEFKSLSFQQQEQQIKQLKATIDTSKTDKEEYEDLLDKYQRYHIIKQDSTYEAYLSRQQKLPENNRDSWFDRILKKREIAINQKSASGNWSVKEELEHYRPKQYFLLMPLLALFIMWNFRKNHIYYLDHLIFTIHGTTAFFIVQIFTVPLRRLLGSGALSSMIQFLVVIGIAWYLFKALTVFYQRPKKMIIKKMITLTILYFIAFWISEWIIERSIYYFIG
jgi:ribosomal protein L37E/cation transport ATPase